MAEFKAEADRRMAKLEQLAANTIREAGRLGGSHGHPRSEPVPADVETQGGQRKFTRASDRAPWYYRLGNF